jgi:hypothetical protein
LISKPNYSNTNPPTLYSPQLASQNITTKEIIMTTNAPTLINLPPPPSDPGTPGDAP